MPIPEGNKEEEGLPDCAGSEQNEKLASSQRKGLGGAEGKNLRDMERPKPVKPTGQAACILEAGYPPRRPQLSPTLTKSTFSVRLPVLIPGVPEIPFTPVRG